MGERQLSTYRSEGTSKYVDFRYAVHVAEVVTLRATLRSSVEKPSVLDSSAVPWLCIPPRPLGHQSLKPLD